MLMFILSPMSVLFTMLVSSTNNNPSNNSVNDSKVLSNFDKNESSSNLTIIETCSKKDNSKNETVIESEDPKITSNNNMKIDNFNIENNTKTNNSNNKNDNDKCCTSYNENNDISDEKIYFSYFKVNSVVFYIFIAILYIAFAYCLYSYFDNCCRTQSSIHPYPVQPIYIQQPGSYCDMNYYSNTAAYGPGHNFDFQKERKNTAIIH